MFNAYTSTCLTTCETGYSPLKDSYGKYYCGACTSTCNSCSVSSTTCTSCANPYFLYSATCITKENIPDGFYGNTTTRTADSCLTECTKCVSSALCTSCISTYFLYQVRISILVTSFSSFFFVFPKKRVRAFRVVLMGWLLMVQGAARKAHPPWSRISLITRK